MDLLCSLILVAVLAGLKWSNQPKYINHAKIHLKRVNQSGHRWSRLVMLVWK